ncbi:MAG: hypothetical protein FWF77_02055, partial [Defluviitaleaceae bacterium]|nr:hypothetical protein [Defluviitaleaceae bacterium]
MPSKPEAISRRKKSAPSARWEPGACVGGGTCPRSRKQFPGAKKARQARGGNRGHVSEATRALEVGGHFPAQKKRVGECHSPTLFLQ